jgi:hypothetical protein
MRQWWFAFACGVRLDVNATDASGETALHKDDVGVDGVAR